MVTRSGTVEGSVKAIKMQMCGRAGLDLPRKRVTYHSACPDHEFAPEPAAVSPCD